MYSNADAFIGPIECIMCHAIIRPVSQTQNGTEKLRKSQKEITDANTIYMCGHEWCTFSIRPKDEFDNFSLKILLYSGLKYRTNR